MKCSKFTLMIINLTNNRILSPASGALYADGNTRSSERKYWKIDRMTLEICFTVKPKL